MSFVQTISPLSQVRVANDVPVIHFNVNESRSTLAGTVAVVSAVEDFCRRAMSFLMEVARVAVEEDLPAEGALVESTLTHRRSPHPFEHRNVGSSLPHSL